MVENLADLACCESRGEHRYKMIGPKLFQAYDIFGKSIFDDAFCDFIVLPLEGTTVESRCAEAFEASKIA